jgi:hypothetical protein
MNALEDRRCRFSQTDGTRSWRHWTGALMAGIVAGYLLFAHGCHGDEDNELFGGRSAIAPASRERERPE